MEREALEGPGSSRQCPSLAGDSLCRQKRGGQSGMETDVGLCSSEGWLSPRDVRVLGLLRGGGI